MTRKEAVDVLMRHADVIRERGVAHLALFGSVARDETGPESDVDVVVNIKKGHKFSIIDHASLRLLLRDILERETDVVIDSSLRSRFRERIAQDKIEVF